MKPRIRKDHFYFGLWECKLRGTITAIGPNPMVAYERWTRVNRITK